MQKRSRMHKIDRQVLLDMLERNQWVEKLDIITMRIIEAHGGDETIDIISGVLADLCQQSPTARKAVNQLYEITSRRAKK